MKKGCLFDLDGTLVNSIEDLAISTTEVLKLHGLPTYDISQYRLFVGNGVKKLMERALGQEHIDLLDECLNDFQKIYRQHCLDHTLPYQGIKELIDEEDKEVCLSDQRIVELMEEKGIKIARRTVAKYRDEMNIPTMSQRRRLRR